MSRTGALVTSVFLLFVPASALRKARGKSSGGKVVTLGDSYSSGVGLHTDADDYDDDGTDCWRDSRRTPGGIYAESAGMTHIIPACGGDVIDDINLQFDQIQATHSDDAADSWEGSVILFTIGGNDLRTKGGEAWPAVITACIMSFYDECHELDSNQMSNLDEVQAQLLQFYTKVAQGAGKASIRVMGYPRMMQPGWNCIPVPGLDLGAADWADKIIDDLNTRMRYSVKEVKRSFPSVDLQFVDATSITRGACSIFNKQINAIKFGGGSISGASFHPNSRGYNANYELLVGSLPDGQQPQESSQTGETLESETLEQAEISRMMKGWDTNTDGKLCISEVLDMLGKNSCKETSKRLTTLFRAADQNRDDSLDLVEVAVFFAAVGKDH